MTKDRIKDLQKPAAWPHVSYQRVSRQAESHDVGDAANGAGNPFTTIVMENEHELTDILTEIDSLRSQIDKIDELAQEVKQIQLDMLAPIVDPKLEHKLDDKRNEVKKMAYTVSTKLKKMEQIQGNQNDADKTTAQWRIRESQIFVITRRFRDTMNDYNQEFIVHRDRCKKIIKRELEIAGGKKSDDELEEMLENGFPGTFTCSVMVDTQKAKEALRGLEERQRDIAKLEASIKELHDMFLDLAVLVAAQGEMIDIIEHNVSKAVNFIEDSAKDIGKIVVRKKNIKKKKIILGVILTAVAVILILIIVTYLSQAKIIG